MNIEYKIAMPSAVDRIINILQEANFEAYAVVGCVRDSLLGRKPEDWDITTSASPEQVKALFVRTIDTGIEHGTVTVMIDHVGYEVTTYRLDGEYEDHRHPKEVQFTTNLAEDLRRRDFTINAMAYNDTTGVVDLFDGIRDLEQGIIRCVGDAMERFDEDALRIFRAVRFSAQLGFEIDGQTEDAMKVKAPTLERISAERLRVELSKLVLGDYPDRLLVAYRTGITKVVLPEWDRMLETEQHNDYHKVSVGCHVLRSIEAMHQQKEYQMWTKKEQLLINMAMLLHDCGKPNCCVTSQDGQTCFDGHEVI